MSHERLERCFLECARRGWRLAIAMVGDPHWASDCVQAAFVAAARKPFSIPSAETWPWFSRVLVHEICNQRRKRKPSFMVEEIEMPDPAPSPARLAEQSENASEIRLALETLPEPERDAIQLTFIGGLSRTEAAQALGVPYKTLNSHISRGLERLRKRLNQREEALLAGLAVLPIGMPPGGWDSALAAWKVAALGTAAPAAATVVGGLIMAKKATVAASVVLALCVGFSAGLLLDQIADPHDAQLDARSASQRDESDVGEGQVRATGTREPVRSIGGEDSANAGTATRLQPDRIDAGRSGTGGAEPSAESRRALLQWLSTLPAQSPALGSGRLYGRVVHRNGSPIAGATITAIAEYDTPYPQSEPAPPLEEMVEHYAMRTAFTRNGTLTAQTDESGRWEMRGLSTLRFQVRARAPGFSCEPSGMLPPSQLYEPDAEIDFVARPVIEIELNPRLPDGSRPKQARAELRFAGGEDETIYWQGWSRTSMVQRSGKCVVHVTAGEYDEYACEPITLELQLGAPPYRVSANLTLRPGILCKVIQPATWGWQSSPGIELLAEPPEGLLTFEQLQGLTRLTAAGRAGSTYFTNLAPGRYRAVAVVGNEILAQEDVQLGTEFKTVTLRLQDLEPAGYLAVRVFSPENELIRTRWLSAFVVKGSEATGQLLRTVPRADGSHWVARVPAGAAVLGGATEWAYVVKCNSEDYGEIEQRVPSSAESVDLRFRHPSRLTITVPGASTHRFKDSLRTRMLRRTENGNWVYAYATPATRWDSGAHTDEIVYAPVPAGSYRFQLITEPAGLGGIRQLRIAEYEFEVQDGDQRQTCPLPPLFQLTVHVDEPASVPWLNLKRAGSDTYDGFRVSGGQQRMEFPGLVRGDWRLTTPGGEMRVLLQRDMEVQLAMRPFDCLALSGVGTGSRLEAMGLQNEDLLVAIDGQGVGDAEALLKLFHESLLREETTWILLREGTQHTLKISGVAISRLKVLEGEARETLSARKAVRD